MAMTEARRHQLFLRLTAALGDEEATTLMEHLPPVGWADVATKHDLAHDRELSRRDLEAVRAEMSFEFAAVRAEMSSEFAAVRAEMAAGFHDVRHEMVALELRIEAGIQRMFRNQTIALMGLTTTLVAAFAAVQQAAG